MKNNRGNGLIIAIVLLAIAAVVIWLALKMIPVFGLMILAGVLTYNIWALVVKIDIASDKQVGRNRVEVWLEYCKIIDEDADNEDAVFFTQLFLVLSVIGNVILAGILVLYAFTDKYQTGGLGLLALISFVVILYNALNMIVSFGAVEKTQNETVEKNYKRYCMKVFSRIVVSIYILSIISIALGIIGQ